MNFSKLRHRIIFLSPTDEIINSMGETVPRYKPFKPYLPLPIQVDADKVYLSHDNFSSAHGNNKSGNGEVLQSQFMCVGFAVNIFQHRMITENLKLCLSLTSAANTMNFRL